MSQSDERNSPPPTVPPRLSVLHPDVELRDSEAEMFKNAPPWVALHVHELRETRRLIQERETAAIEREFAEQKRADVRHLDAQNLAKEFLQLGILQTGFRKVESKLEQLRVQIVGTRKDIGSIVARQDLTDVRLDDHQQRIEALEQMQMRDD